MKIIGIIAEYNPFHNGHAYQLSKIREETGADYIAVAMSGDFVQRGEPAIIDKYARTEMALQSGADLALELPVLWSTASAEAFAMASVTLFEKMGCVDGICFGAETDNLPLLTTIADILTDEPEDYRRLLSSFLKKGMSFPSARAQALCEINTENSSFKTTIEILSDILSSPNNILAIEYLKALKRLHSSMKPILLKRIGAGYHDTEINAAENNSQKKAEAIPTASATAIRNLVFSKNTVISPVIPASPASVLLSDVLQSSMPDSALRILTDYLKQYPPIHVDDFSPLLGYQLLTRDKSSISHIGDITPEIANR
ncbi:MAG: nucleotidyltransferase family protein, partial [Roseburia sp.]|nr:nucleotidyltransferase family protein [Roseburia sp.]